KGQLQINITRDYMSALHTSISINERLENTFFPTKAFYILNDGLTMTLIWKDGELLV
ncbi:hypothetical protein U3O_02585, partial [Staphylococcus aureus M0934]